MAQVPRRAQVVSLFVRCAPNSSMPAERCMVPCPQPPGPRYDTGGDSDDEPDACIFAGELAGDFPGSCEMSLVDVRIWVSTLEGG
jgi:hypothetical protein